MIKERILGLDVIVSDYKHLLNQIREDVIKKRKKTIVAINPEKILTARKDEKLKGSLNKADYQIPDGMGVILASIIKGGKIKSRITGVDTFTKICELAANEGFKIFLYGAKEEQVLGAKNKLISMYPTIQIAGHQNGYEKDEAKVIKKINDSKAQILFVALGSPKQEDFTYRNFDKLNINIFQGVGGSFDVISGNIKRAPEWMKNTGLEWFYRLLKEPKRIFRQVKLIKFIFLAIFSK